MTTPTRPPLDADELRALLAARGPAGPPRGRRQHRVHQRGRRATCGPTRRRGRSRACWSPTTRPPAEGARGRTWETPPGTVADLLVRRPAAGAAGADGWLPLLAGLGAVTAMRATAGVPAVAQVAQRPAGARPTTTLDGWGPYRKVGGILAAGRDARGRCDRVVVGIGLNVSQTPQELPVPSASSLALAGAQHVDRAGVLVALVGALEDRRAPVGRRRRRRARLGPGRRGRRGLPRRSGPRCA